MSPRFQKSPQPPLWIAPEDFSQAASERSRPRWRNYLLRRKRSKPIQQYNTLLERSKEPVFYAFDLLWLDGADLKDMPLIERKNRLSKLVQSSECNRLLYAQHIEEYGRHFFKEICERDLEGIIAKRKMSIYKRGGNGWLKITNRAYTQAEGGTIY